MTMRSSTSSTPLVDVAGDSRRRLGVPAITFLIIAASAPLTVVAGGVTTTFTVTHVSGVPLGYIALALALAVFTIGYAAMSRFVTNAGAFYAYIAQGIGRPVGVGSALVALVSYNAMQIGIYGIFGFQVASFVKDKTGIDVPWWVTVFAAIVVVGIFGVNRVDVSAKVLGVLVSVEFVLVIIFDVMSFASPAAGSTLEPITPAALFTPAIGAVLSFGIAAFMGFESAAIYGEEAKDPKKTVSRATFLALGVIGVFYALSSWALAVAIGANKITDPNGITAAEAGPPLFFNFVAAHGGTVLVDVMNVFFITSVFAALVSFHNAVARYTFSLAREGLLPPRLARVRLESGAPWAGSASQTVTAVVVIAGFAIASIGSVYGAAFPVITLFAWLPNAGAMGLVMLMALVSISVIGYFRKHPGQVGIGVAIVAPIISFVALAVIFVLILTNFDVLLGQAEPNAVSFILPAIIVVPGLLGVGWGLVLRRSGRAVYHRIGHGADAVAQNNDTGAGLT